MCFPGTDQTERGPQRWSILAAGKQQRVSLPDSDDITGRLNTPAHYLEHRSGFGALALLLNASSAPLHVDATIPAGLVSPSANSAIERLPTELLMAILQDCVIPTDILAIALCSQTLWTQVAHYIRSSYAKSKDSWVGTPLACVGSYLTALPPGFEEVLPEVVQAQKVFPRDGYGRPPARSWGQNAIYTHKDVAKSDMARCWLYAFDAYTYSAAIMKPILRQLRVTLHDHILQAPSQSVHGDRDWVLRNLSKKQFVRLTPSARSMDVEHNHSLILCVSGSSPELSVDKALVLRTCWSASRDNTLRFDPDKDGLSRGGWAGDSFDVVPAMDADAREKWTDATSVMLERWNVVEEEHQSMCRQSSHLRKIRRAQYIDV